MSKLDKFGGYESLEEKNEDIIAGALYTQWKIYQRTPLMTDEEYQESC